MKKFFKGCLIFVGIFLVFIAVLIGCFVYETEYKVTEVGREVSDDGQYEIVFQMIGEPDFPFGKTTVQLTVQNADGTTIKKVKTYIYDDGAAFKESNWNVLWNDKTVDIILMGSEQDDVTYSIPLK